MKYTISLLTLIVVAVQTQASNMVDTLIVPNNVSLQLESQSLAGQDNGLKVFWFGDSVIVEGYVAFRTGGESGIIYSISNDTIMIDKYETGTDTMYSYGNYVRLNLGNLPMLAYKIVQHGFREDSYYGSYQCEGNKGKLWDREFLAGDSSLGSVVIQTDYDVLEPTLFIKDGVLCLKENSYWTYNHNTNIYLFYGIKEDSIFTNSQEFFVVYWGGEERTVALTYLIELGKPKYDEYYLNGLKLKVQELTSVDKVDVNLPIIYPNPVSTHLYITNFPQENTTYELYSLGGKLLKKDKINQNLIDFSHLYAGVYILHLENQNGEILHQKFVKQ